MARDPNAVRAVSRGVTERDVTRVTVESEQRVRDDVVIEEPLEIRVDGEPLAVTMRTPGHDRELAAGFLFGEGVLHDRGEIGSISHCGRLGDEGYGNVIDMVSAPGARLAVERLDASRRGSLTTASCGVCGRRTIDDLLARCTNQVDPMRVRVDTILGAIEGMRAVQTVFQRTGGLHAAGVFDAEGRARIVREDIGRHNAVDKATGAMLLEGALPAAGCMLAVSGRASFEMVQKAVVAGLAVVVSVSAVSSLAIDLAAKTGTTLVGFARDGRMNIYAHDERVVR